MIEHLCFCMAKLKLVELDFYLLNCLLLLDIYSQADFLSAHAWVPFLINKW